MNADSRGIAPEIFIGIIDPLGSPTDKLQGYLENELKRCKYTPIPVRFSDELAKLGSSLSNFHDTRARQLMDIGNRLCSQLRDKQAVLRLGIRRLTELRQDIRVERRAWILRSLKRPEEVDLLRAMYGQAFYAVAVNTSYETRIKHFATVLRISRPTLTEEEAEARAIRMIERDESETVSSGVRYGQNVRETFPLADVIVPGDRMDALEGATHRFVDLLFGDIRVPNKREHAMFLADGTAAQSSSLSRQVGACLTTDDGEVISVGSNEVPKAGGGQYGDTDPYGRDKDLDTDYSALSLRYLAATTLAVIQGVEWQHIEDDELDKQASEVFARLSDKKAPLASIIEYMRAVHAEAAALLDAARRGVATRGAVLFTTTYPCHLCAKEIVAAGIKQVVYIETYPKSRAQSMYGEEISSIIRPGDVSRRVPFIAFEGVTPRAYRRLFLATRPRRKSDQGRVLPFVPDWPQGGEDLLALVQSREMLEDGVAKPVENINGPDDLQGEEPDDTDRTASDDSGSPGQ